MSQSATTDKKTNGTSRVLTLTLGKELYAVNVLDVREIIRPLDISPVPRAPAEFLGVINLRGKIVPVVDLRIKFGLAFTGRTERTCIVVVQTGKNLAAQKLTGLLVDEVQEVVTLNQSNVEEAPNFGATMEASYIRGLAKSKESVMILLDLERLLGASKTEAAQ
jgi:purine-binding chemotaxis protein CheW